MKTQKNKNIILARRITQSVSFLFLLFIVWNTGYPLRSFINPQYYFYFDPLVMFATAVAERILLPGLGFAVFMFLLAFFFGRAFCGWVCPLGALIDFCAPLNVFIRKIVRRRVTEGEPKKARFVKYALLVCIAIGAAAGFQFAWLFDPITIIVRAFSFNIHPAVNKAIDSAFAWIIGAAGYPIWLDMTYNWCRDNFLSVTVPRFPHSGVILSVFVGIIIACAWLRRFWCRYLCPLGALFALPARFSLLRRRVDSCREGCSACKNVCRMNAISDDGAYIAEECILCWDCIAVCSDPGAGFVYSVKTHLHLRSVPMTRAGFISMAMGVAGAVSGIIPQKAEGKLAHELTCIIRPPGSLPEDEFIQRCIRCGNCMKVCPTNVLQPSTAEAGLSALWTPRLEPARGYCEYECNLCGRVCPTGAITEIEVEKKKTTIIGTAVFDKKICLPWAKGEGCIVCEEHCPVSEKAIKLRVEKGKKGGMIMLPYVDKKLCIGCMICENKCPVTPVRAVRVFKRKK